jgi:hypothetical protein
VHRAEAQSLGAAWARSLPPGLERAGEWEGDLLVRVTATAREGARRDLLSTRETPRGVPLVPLDRCSGWLELASSVPDPWRPLTSATLQVRVHNTGTSSWPGFGFVPRHLVRLKACVRGEGSPCIADAVPLPADVPPGGTLSVGVAPKSPLWGGAYELELSLLQVGDGPLARCGVAPLRVPVRVVGPLQGARPRGRGG